MKRLKGIWTTLIIIILSVMMVMSVGAVTAFGAAGAVGSPTAVSDYKHYSNFECGQTYVLTGATKVILPNGKMQDTGLDAFIPTQVGAYTIYVGDMSYNVSCNMAKEFELRVNKGGAAIATYIAINGDLTIPSAFVYAKNDKGEFVKDSTIEVKSKIDGNDATIASANTERKIKMDKAGTYTVHYYVSVPGKYLYQDYTVKVLSKFTDTTNPTLNVVNVPLELSLRTKITLPTATVADDYDANVKVTVTVSMYDKDAKKYTPVKQVTPDENGFGKDISADDVDFDNKTNMVFYPMQATSYQIVYLAEDDMGNKTNERTYTATCLDKSAPILKEIKSDIIPSKWGVKTIKYNDPSKTSDDKTGTEIGSKEITFPYPTYVDNSDETPKVSFEIKDTINNQTVVKINNIYDRDKTTGVSNENAKYKKGVASNGLYPDELDFTKDGLKGFDFSKYTTLVTDGKTYTGTYTVTYQAQDSRPNISTKSYDITIEDNVVDLVAPSIDVNFEDSSFFTVTEYATAWTVPVLTVSDAEDKRDADSVTTVYKLKSGTNSILVKGGEKAVFQNTKEKESDATKKDYLIVTNKDSSKTYLELVDFLEWEISAKDDVGNVKESNSTDATKIGIKTVADFEWNNNEVITNTADLFNNLTGGAYDDAEREPIKPGSMTIKLAANMRDFVGFEMYITNDKNEVLNIPISFSTYFIDGNKLTPKSAVYEYKIEDIMFTLPSTGTYNFFVRVFDIFGQSIHKQFSYTLVDTTTDEDDTSALGVPVSGSVYTQYQLKNKTIKTPADMDLTKNYIVREVVAEGKFSMMGTLFTSYTSGDYKFHDKYNSTKSVDLVDADKLTGSYKLAVSEKGTPVWSLQSQMPTYSAKDAVVELPFVVANVGYSNAKISLSVSVLSDTLSVADRMPTDAEQLIENENKKVIINAKGQYQFKAEIEGVYTVTYSAAYGSELPAPQSYTIKVGDTTAPTFSLKNKDADTTESSHATRATENGTFEFLVVGLENDEAGKPEDVSKMRFVKKLKAPDGEVVFLVDEKGESGRTRKLPIGKEAYKFEKTGTYTVEYVVYDGAGNENPQTIKINVSAKNVNNPVSTKVISVVLIIVGVLLIAGVILYFVRFRKVKAPVVAPKKDEKDKK